jgi:hypothetical protein
MVPGFPKLQTSKNIDNSMCTTNRDCLGIDPDVTRQLSQGDVGREETGVPNLPVCCEYCEYGKSSASLPTCNLVG